MQKKKVKKIIIILITICFTGVAFLPLASSFNVNFKHNESIKNVEILKEIQQIDNKNLVIDKIIGDVIVKYWQHEINNIIIKNDYILLHQDLESKEIIKYEKKWTDITLPECPEFLDKNFEEYYWMQIVLFPDKEDLTYFYSFNKDRIYPIVCCEVRHIDGRTILYDMEGNRIGNGIPTPCDGFSLSGYNNATWADPWIGYRENADLWFSKWCDISVSLSLPTPSTISSYVSNSNVMYFYELAHGDEFHFQADSIGSSYTVAMVQIDMAERQPIEFAFLGSCHGMTGTGPDTFSYEFRKGQMSNTVTVGYDNMETCPGWQYAIPWQDSMFENMSKGMTIKNAFDMATAQYPTISPAVVFLGDQNLIVPFPPSKPAKPSGPLSGKIGISYSYSTSSIDINSDKVKYGWDWNGDSVVDVWDDNNGNYYSSGTTISTSHSWNNQDSYSIKVKAEDINGGQSDWSDPLTVTIPKKRFFNVQIDTFLMDFPTLFLIFQCILEI
jgi:hypothetical protein